MKSMLTKSPLTYLITIFALLTLLMLATRGHHFSSFDQLPSSSTAIFFIAGMYLRNIKSFWYFYLLSIAIDLTSSYFRGHFSDCLTLAYPALALCYATMFYAGFYSRANWSKHATIFSIVNISIALFIATSVSFILSNGSYYLLSGKFPDLSWTQYSLRVDQYFFRYVTNPIFYVVSAVVIDWTISHFLSDRTMKSSYSSDRI